MSNIKVQVLEYNKIENEQKPNQAGRANILVNDSVIINDVILRTKEDGNYAVNFPGRMNKDGEWEDYITGVSNEFRETTIKALETNLTGEYDSAYNEGYDYDKPDKIYMKSHLNKKEIDNFKGYASLTIKASELDEKSLFTIKNISLLENKNGNLFIGMPQNKFKEEYKTEVDFKSEETKFFARNLIVNEYEKTLEHTQEVKEEEKTQAEDITRDEEELEY